MEITQKAQAGSLESSDTLVSIAPNDKLDIEIRSSVKSIFGKLIETSVKETLKKYQIKNAKITIDDHGAIHNTIVARLETAISRSTGK